MKLTYIIWFIFFLIVAIGISCIEDPTSANKRMQKDSSFMITGAIDSAGKIYNGNKINNLIIHQAPILSNSFELKAPEDLSLWEKNSPVTRDTRVLKYKKIGDAKTKKTNRKFKYATESKINTFNRKLTKDTNNNIKNLLIKITDKVYLFVFNGYRIFWQSHPFGKEFYFCSDK